MLRVYYISYAVVQRMHNRIIFTQIISEILLIVVFTDDQI